jgi:RNA polymerase sigma-70 factor (ECF subfamily)
VVYTCESNDNGNFEYKLRGMGVQYQHTMSTSVEHSGLLSLIAQGDQGSMRLLMDQYTGLVWSLVRKKIANTADAEDLVQEVFTEIWKCANRYNADMGSEATFIAVITRRRVIDAVRKLGRKSSSVPFDGVVEFSAATEDKTSIAEPEVAAAMQIMQEMNPQRRTVLELSIIQGLSHSQIVEATDLPLGTVKAHIRRGLEKIRDEITASNSTRSKEGVSR